MMSMSAEAAAEQILAACQRGRGEVFIHNPLNLTVGLQKFFPEMTQEILAVAATVLPKMGGIGRDAAKGYESESAWSPSVLTMLTQAAVCQHWQGIGRSIRFGEFSGRLAESCDSSCGEP